MASTMVGFAKPPLIPTKAGIAAAAQAQLAPSQALPSSTTQPTHHNKAQADSSKKEKVSVTNIFTKMFPCCFLFFQPSCNSLFQKQQIQEKAINEVKTAIKPFYQRKEITKDEYKEIVRKAVEKVNRSVWTFVDSTLIICGPSCTSQAEITWSLVNRNFRRSWSKRTNPCPFFFRFVTARVVRWTPVRWLSWWRPMWTNTNMPAKNKIHPAVGVAMALTGHYSCLSAISSSWNQASKLMMESEHFPFSYLYLLLSEVFLWNFIFC